MSSPAKETRAAPAFARVAVPVPVAEGLSYRIPESWIAGLQVGCRVRVTVGRRRLVGMVVALEQAAPEGVEAKEILEVLDLEPPLTPEIIALAEFTADYYLAPIGEVLRSMLPASLPPWGNRRVSLTDAGALAAPRSDGEARLREFLLGAPRSRLGDVQRALGLPDLGPLVDELRRLGRLSVEEPGGRGTRYVKAYEARPGDLAAQLESCGRSPQGRAVLEFLKALGRPATGHEIRRSVGCGAQVLRRLVALDLLRQFTQPERLSLDRHQLEARSSRPVVLRPDQEAAAGAVQEALDRGGYRGFLLRGMTGSGKTEVYLRSIAHTLGLGRSAILLVPEIALVPALARAVRERFGNRLAILHSNLSTAERHQEWERLRRGTARLALGPRSALFAPVTDLGLVIVDEEHDAAYKQDKTPRYNGRDLALLRARQQEAVAVVVSATPSLESRFNVRQKKLAPLILTARVGHGRLPEGHLVDLRRERVVHRPGDVHFTPFLREKITAALEAGDQVILLRNRRGYSPVLLCRACGEDFRCSDCGLPFTYHLRRARLVCHYCDRERPVPSTCPECGEAALEPIGAGTERVEETFRELYPGVPADVLDADASRRAGGAAAVLERFASGRSQVLIGTQMVSKGHHFPRVSLAAVLFADTYLSFPDFRAVERTYALLTQLAGRAGRGDRPGEVVIQTFHPDHYAIRAALEHDDDAFAAEEMRFRRTFRYPPFTRMVQLLLRNKDHDKGEGQIRDLERRVLRHPLSRGVLIAGPALAPLERLRNQWRFQLLLRCESGSRLRRIVRDILAQGSVPDLTVDVDPYDLM